MPSLSGIASGADTDSIVKQLVDAESAKRLRMDWRAAQIGARSDGLTSVQSKLTALRTAVQALRDVGTWADTQTVESSDTRVAARRTSGAAAGGYTVDVVSLARAEQRGYTYTPPTDDEALSVGGFSVTLTAGTALADAVSMINGAASSPVYASAVNGRLVLSARATGAASAFTASGSMLAEDATLARAGQDATFRVDGGALRSSASNVVADAVPGIELTFKGVTAATASLVVGVPGADTAAVRAKVETFVTAYNDLVKTTRGLLDEQTVKGASNAADYAKGALRGDSGLQSLLNGLRQAVMDPIAGNPAAMDELREIGLSTGKASSVTSSSALTGLLELDADKLATALTDPQAVRRLLGGTTGAAGFAQRVETQLQSQLGINGLFAQRIGEARTATTDLQAQMTREDQRLATVESRLKTQFALMEQALLNAQSQQSWLTGQLAALG